MSIVCSQCGFHNPPGMRYCGNCGTRLVEEKMEPQQAAPEKTTRAHGEQPPVVDPASLGVLTGADLLERFHKAGLEASGQRRSVTVLFVDLSDYTRLSEELSDEELYELVQKFIRLLVNDVYKYEGMVDKLTGDGLMALFGAPIAHENNAERAIRSAMDMVSDVAKLSQELVLHGYTLNVHIGIHSGSVIVGELGGNGVMNYTAIGDSVNLARRLEEVASPGVILVSEKVFRRTSRLFNFEQLPPVSLKNISKEVQAFRVVSMRSKASLMRGIDGLQAPLIGRETEYAQIKQKIDRLVAHGIGGVILLVGEGGMGKSRLTREIRLSLDESCLAIFEGQSLTYRKPISYWIFQDMLRNFMGLPGNSPASMIQQRLAETLSSLLGDEGSTILPYLEHLFSIQPSDMAARERFQYLDPGQLRQQVFLAVRDFLVGVARNKPVLLILEDLHWADEASLELIRFLMDSTRSSPIILYAITRPFEGEVINAIHERAQQRLAGQYLLLRLEALLPDQSEKLLDALITITDFPEELHRQIIERSAGLPFYLEEILRMLMEQQIIIQREGHWQLTSVVDIGVIGVPESLQGLILARFDRLALPQQIILQTASVIGYRFSTQILRQVLSAETEFSPAVIDESLHLLLEREFIIPQEGIEEEAENGNGAGEVNYQFRHVLVSDAVYSTLLQRDRRELHTRVGEVIENMYRDRLDGYIEVLAGHYLRSPYLDRALHYLALAGEKAARSYANDQALQFFRQALEILPKVSPSAEQSMRVHSGLGDALLIAGDYTGAREQYVEAIESLGLPGRTGLLRYPPVKQDGMAMDRTSYLSLLSQLQRKIGKALENQGEYDRALAYIRSAQLVLLDEPVAFAIERANCLNDTGWIYFRRGSLDEAEKVLNEGLQLAIPAGQLDLTASILNRLAGVYFQRNAVDQAANYMKRSLRIREEIGDVVAVARSYNNLGLIDWKQGALQAALDEFNRSYRLHENLGDIEGQIVLQTNMGLIELDLGNLSEARRRFQEALDNARQIGHSFHICMTQMHLALLNVYAENWPAVLEYGLLSLAGFQELGVKENLLDISVSLGWAYVGLSDDLHCREIEASILSMLSEGQGPGGTPPESHGRAYRLLSSLAGLRGDLDGAARAIERSVEIFSQAGSLLERSRSLVFLGKSLAAQGKMDLAMPLFYEARQVFQKMGARLELSRLEKLQQEMP